MPANASSKKRPAPRKPRLPRRVSRAKSVGSLFLTALDFSDDEAALIFRRMLTIRRLDEALIRLTRRHGAPVPPAPGREAIGVAACSVCKPTDFVFSHEWRHGLIVARTGSVASAVSEWLPHLRGDSEGTDPAAHPACTILNGGMALAVGAGLAARLNRQNQAVLCFCDAADVAKGSFHETMNLTTSWKLPIVFIFPEIETPRSSNRGRVLAHAQHYDVEGVLVDGSNVSDVRSAVIAALERARNSKGATLIEAAVPAAPKSAKSTAAADGGGDAAAELKNLRDPIRIFRNLLSEAALLTDEDVTALEREVAAEVKTALARLTDRSAVPGRELLLKHVLKGWSDGKFGLMRS